MSRLHDYSTCKECQRERAAAGTEDRDRINLFLAQRSGLIPNGTAPEPYVGKHRAAE